MVIPICRRTLRHICILAAGIALAGLAAAEARGQIIHGQRPQVSQSLTYMSWQISGKEDYTIAQWFIPVSVSTPIVENLELAVSSGVSRSEADWDISGDDINGLVDSRIQLAASFFEDQVILSGGVSLPTGKTELTPTQQKLLGFLTSDFLNFPVKNPGEGLGVFGEIGFAIPVGSWVFGAAGAAFVPGEYNPYDTELSYKPGTRIIGTLGLERGWEKHHFIGADAVVVVSADDEADGKPIFRDGTQLDLRLTGRVAIGTGSIEAGVRYILRGEDRRVSEDHTTLVRETHNNNGNDLRLHFSPRIPLSASAALWLTYDGKILAANKYDTTDALFEDAARIHGAGGGLDLRLSRRAVVRLGVRVWSGSSDGAHRVEPFDLTGYEVIERLTLTF